MQPSDDIGGSVTTVDSAPFLDIINPRIRVFELRKCGHHIATVSVARATERRAHRWQICSARDDTVTAGAQTIPTGCR
ncbi:helix-turn-helix domain-containing protein [Paraburkholderia diazotrophica]|uniref:helix-turn-helix domain-containing protein n=1 Tax=Paraburkholderia diazotrophica TaxID=667676 RepID=UPI0015A6C3AA